MQIKIKDLTTPSKSNDDSPSRSTLGYQWRPSLQSATVSRFAKSRAPEDLAELYKAFKKWELAKYPPIGVKIKPKGVIRIK
jgi:hypothetical protein|tara:strand:- start:560 stop:802 length:243 start_codon:yes stop_codon:yes gene_type:complete